MSSTPDGFRSGLRTTLLLITDARAREEFQKAHPYLDAKTELMAEIQLDIPDPLTPQFVSEFEPEEVAEIERFLVAVEKTKDWDLIVRLASELLSKLPPA
jgi:hypothetical protein